uniref:Ig-like domain-containing protein n=1 Tax=Alistipes finegoldii TaxID=214856 RepID=UPI00272F542C
MRLLLKYLLFILLPAYTYGQSGRPDAGITFEVTDSLHNPLAYATVALTPMSGGGKAYATTTDEEGRARFTPREYLQCGYLIYRICLPTDGGTARQ